MVLRKSLIALLLATLAPLICANANDIPVDAIDFPPLASALQKAGVQWAGPEDSRILRVTDLACSGGFNQFLSRNTADCDFTEGDKKVQISGGPAIDLINALANAGLIKRGLEMSGTLKTLECKVWKIENGRAFGCKASN